MADDVSLSDPEIELDDLQSLYDSDDSDADDASIAIDGSVGVDGDGRRRDIRLRSSSIDKTEDDGDGDEDGARPDPAPHVLPAVTRVTPGWQEDNTPILDAGPILPPPDYAAATAHREEEERQRRALRQEALEDQDWSVRESAEAFGSQHPLVRNGLLRDPNNNNNAETVEIAETPGPPSAVGETRRDSSQSSRPSTIDEEEKAEALQLIGYWSRKRRAWKRRGKWMWLRICLGAPFALLLIYFTMTNTSFKRITGMRLRPQASESQLVGGLHRSKPEQDHPSTPECHWTDYKRWSIELEYYMQDQGSSHYNFSFLENLIRASDDIRLSGTIEVTKQEYELDSAARISIEIATTAGVDVTEIKHELPEMGAFELLYPEVGLQQPSGCMDISVTIEHQRAWQLANLVVNSTNFDIDLVGEFLFSEDFDPWTGSTNVGLLVDNAMFSTKYGSIYSDWWEARRTEVRTEEGQIDGNFGLRDALSLNSVSRDIRIGVTPLRGTRAPHDGDRDVEGNANSYNAELFATSVDGTIKLAIEPEDDDDEDDENDYLKMPKRDYQSQISTVHGDVYGDYLLGSNVSLVTKTGKMNVRVVPVALEPPNATLYTENDSGFSNIMVLNPMTLNKSIALQSKDIQEAQALAKNRTMSSLRLTHNSGSGSVHYILPNLWSGTGVLECGSQGKIVEPSDPYEVVENKEGEGEKKTSIRRGHGDSVLTIHTGSGEIYLDANAG